MDGERPSAGCFRAVGTFSARAWEWLYSEREGLKTGLRISGFIACLPQPDYGAKLPRFAPSSRTGSAGPAGAWWSVRNAEPSSGRTCKVEEKWPRFPCSTSRFIARRRDRATEKGFGSIGWHTFRHSYRTLLIAVGAPHWKSRRVPAPACGPVPPPTTTGVHPNGEQAKGAIWESRGEDPVQEVVKVGSEQKTGRFGRPVFVGLDFRVDVRKWLRGRDLNQRPLGYEPTSYRAAPPRIVSVSTGSYGVNQSGLAGDVTSIV